MLTVSPATRLYATLDLHFHLLLVFVSSHCDSVFFICVSLFVKTACAACCLSHLCPHISGHLNCPPSLSQRRLGDAAKKAIGKLTTRTVKKGDKVRPLLYPVFPVLTLTVETRRHEWCVHTDHTSLSPDWLTSDQLF